MDAIKNWLNSDPVVEGDDATAGDYLRSFIENLWKAVVNLLNSIGEWPIK
jgi:hypothetical protein